jgi:4a-hydroxytetrahydrobiopterin dehydratase
VSSGSSPDQPRDLMTARQQLLALHCRPLDASSALGDEELAATLRELPGWAVEGGAIVRTYAFANYFETIAFVNALAFMVHREDHHPDLVVGYNRCTVRFSTHSADGITQNDLICAAKSDAIFEQTYRPE